MITQREKAVMLEMINREMNGCERCGKKATILHHIQRRVAGGKDIPRNLMGLCATCHKLFHENEPGLRRR